MGDRTTELAFWRRKCRQHEAILTYLASLAGINDAECYSLDSADTGIAHLEVIVDNGEGPKKVNIAFGVDSDVAQLAEILRTSGGVCDVCGVDIFQPEANHAEWCSEYPHPIDTPETDD